MSLETPFLEPIRVLSDLHLGHPTGYVQRADQIAPLLEGARTIVFNGDSVEMRFPGRKPSPIDPTQGLRQLCLDHHVQPIFLNGNHDPALSDRNHLDLAGGKVFVMHGDALHPHISPWSRNAQEIGEAHARLLHALGPKPTLEQRLHAAKQAEQLVDMHQPGHAPSSLARLRNIALELWPPRRPWLILKSWIETSRLAAEFTAQFRPAAQTVLIGHIHAPSIRRISGRLIINTGCFLPPLPRTCVDITANSIMIRPIQRRADRTFALRPAAHSYPI